MMAGAGFVPIVFMAHLLSGSVSTQDTNTTLVWQPSKISVERGNSKKINCTFSVTLHYQKPSLTWVKREKNGKEATIYPASPSTKQVQVYVNSEVFKSQSDAGIQLENLQMQDSGIYICCITVLKNGVPMVYRGHGTRVTVTGSLLDSLVACCPIGVFVAALLVLHVMVYRKWVDYKNATSSSAIPSKDKASRIPRICFCFRDLLPFPPASRNHNKRSSEDQDGDL